MARECGTSGVAVVGIFTEQPLLAALSLADRSALRSSGSPRVFPAGQVIIAQGARDDFVATVEAGWAVVRADSSSGRSVILGIRGPEDLVGEMAALDGNPRSATVVAMTEIRAVVLSGTRFRGFLNDRPYAAAAMLRGMTLRLRAADEHRQDLATLPVLPRLARLLLRMDDVRRNSGGAVKLTQQEIADSIGATRESVAKALADLRERNMLRTGTGVITILDRDALAAVSKL